MKKTNSTTTAIRAAVIMLAAAMSFSAYAQAIPAFPGADGLVLGSSSVHTTNAWILNCDSYRNYQVGSGGNNGDGFAAKSGSGPGNVFRGCRAWDNADDGWDFYNKDEYAR